MHLLQQLATPFSALLKSHWRPCRTTSRVIETIFNTSAISVDFLRSHSALLRLVPEQESLRYISPRFTHRLKSLHSTGAKRQFSLARASREPEDGRTSASNRHH